MKLPTTKIGWLLLIVVVLVLMTAIADHAKAETKIGIHGGHWSHHWLSEDVTNEEHAWLGVRINNLTFGRANNSYKQEGFDGEIWYVGYIRDWVWFGNINRWQGDILARGSIGAMHGYTVFGGHDPDRSPGVFPYIAGGLYYQQPIDRTLRWEAGWTQMGDASVPSLGLEARF